MPYFNEENEYIQQPFIKPIIEKHEIKFANALVVSQDKVKYFEGLPLEYLFHKWNPNYPLDEVASALGVESGQLIDKIVVSQAIAKGYDGLVLGKKEIVDLKTHPRYIELQKQLKISPVVVAPAMENIIKKVETGIFVTIKAANKDIGTFTLEGSAESKSYTIIDALIKESERGKGYYSKSIIDLIEKNPDINITSVFRSPEADKVWARLFQKSKEEDATFKIVKTIEEGEVVYVLTKKSVRK